MIEYITSLKPVEVLIGFSVAVGAVVILLITIAVVLDLLNVKKITVFPFSIEFYKEGESKRTRITHKTKTVAHKRKVVK